LARRSQVVGRDREGSSLAEKPELGIGSVLSGSVAIGIL
jgi:hypothetical protein